MSAVPVDRSADVMFAAFYAREHDGQVRRAMMLLGSNDCANDVVQDAFIAIYKRWGQIDDPGPYLNTAILNGCRAVHRKRSRLRRTQPARTESATHDIDDSMGDVLAKLPFNQRAAIVLRFYFALSTAEIAHELRCAPGSVGPWIDRGLEKMRKALR